MIKFCKTIICICLPIILCEAFIYSSIMLKNRETIKQEIEATPIEIINEPPVIEEQIKEETFMQTIDSWNEILIVNNILERMKGNSFYNTNDAYKIYNTITKYCDFYNVDPKVIFTVIATESDFNRKAISRAGKDSGYGLMQVSKIALTDYNNKHWRGEQIPQEWLTNIDYNIKVGIWFWKYNGTEYAKFNIEDHSQMYFAYNVGYYAATRYPEKYLNDNTYNAMDRYNELYTLYWD